MAEANVRRRDTGSPEPRRTLISRKECGQNRSTVSFFSYPPEPEDARFMFRSLLALALVTASIPVTAEEPSAFKRTTIDIGCVVTDIDKSVKFYTEGIGFREVKSFEVPADLARDAGLTDSRPLSVRVLTLGDDDTATRLKLMQVVGTLPRTGDNDFIHSHTGFRYLTIMVADTDAAVARLEKLGVKPIAKSPVALPDSLAPGMSLTCVRDPDGNLVELLGPSKK
jgi:catechol 2,3-dioxygenase-like lactoylglutathione lyase family enzyme